MNIETIKLLVKALTEEIEKSALKAKPPEPRAFRIGEWCRREDAREEFGISPHRLKQLVTEKKVKAKKFDCDDPTSIVLFRTQDIRNAIEAMPDYLYNTEKEAQNEAQNDHEGGSK